MCNTVSWSQITELDQWKVQQAGVSRISPLWISALLLFQLVSDLALVTIYKKTMLLVGRTTESQTSVTLITDRAEEIIVWSKQKNNLQMNKIQCASISGTKQHLWLWSIDHLHSVLSSHQLCAPLSAPLMFCLIIPTRIQPVGHIQRFAGLCCTVNNFWRQNTNGLPMHLWNASSSSLLSSLGLAWLREHGHHY